MFVCKLFNNDLFVNIFGLVFLYFVIRLNPSCNTDVRKRCFYPEYRKKFLLHENELSSSIQVILYKLNNFG